MMSRLLHATAALGALSLAALGTTACGETVEIGELSPRIVSVGPIDYDDGVATLSYGLNDPAGNDQDLSIEFCNVATNQCGPAARPATSSDGTTSVPTRPRGTDVTRYFAWHVGCGKLVDDRETAFDLDQTYFARITLIRDGDEVESGQFSLEDDLGLSELPECP